MKFYREKYLILLISFESLVAMAFENETNFISALFGLLKKTLNVQWEDELVDFITELSPNLFYIKIPKKVNNMES